MNVWGLIAGGFAGTLVLTTIVAAASQLGWTRMDLPFLLGTAFTPNRVRAKMIGYAIHFGLGLLFALVYNAVFLTIHQSGWLVGAAFGVVHALFLGTVVVNILLPPIHPLMGTDFSAADSQPLLEPPGFMMLNYGRNTPLISLVGHVLYGTIVGAFAAMAGP